MLFTGVSATHGIFMRNAKLFQVPSLGPWVFPLFPDNAPHSADDPAFERLEHVPGFRQAVIIPPADEVPIQSLHDLVQTFPAVAVRPFPESGLEALDRLSVNPDFGLSTHTDECKSQEFTQPRSTHRTFRLVDLELELHGDKLRNALFYTLGGLPALAVNHEVVGISDEFVTSRFQLFIQFIEYDVGEQWR